MSADAQQQQQQQSTWWPAQLVPVALLDEQPFLQDLAAAIRAHNSRVQQQQQPLSALQQARLPPLIVPLLASTVHQTAAAVALQSAWRSHQCRLVEDVAQRLLKDRAARCIQRAWHACEWRLCIATWWFTAAHPRTCDFSTGSFAIQQHTVCKQTGATYAVHNAARRLVC
jgi:hypothetical protein